MGVLADRTNTRWGKFRPWVLWTSIPWAVVMVLAYTTPHGWSMGMMIAYAGHHQHDPDDALLDEQHAVLGLGRRHDGDLNERTKLNSFRFVSANIAQFIVGGLTLPLVAKFAAGSRPPARLADDHDHLGGLCFVLFLVTFLSPPRSASARQ
jgi:GPH family glycoside/pentoside/hexuronide:cation symporter